MLSLLILWLWTWFILAEYLESHFIWVASMSLQVLLTFDPPFLQDYSIFYPLGSQWPRGSLPPFQLWAQLTWAETMTYVYTGVWTCPYFSTRRWINVLSLKVTIFYLHIMFGNVLFYSFSIRKSNQFWPPFYLFFESTSRFSFIEIPPITPCNLIVQLPDCQRITHPSHQW